MSSSSLRSAGGSTVATPDPSAPSWASKVSGSFRKEHGARVVLDNGGGVVKGQREPSKSRCYYGIF